MDCWIVLGGICQLLLCSLVVGEFHNNHSYNADCEAYIEDLSGAVTELTDCYITHATPVSFCGWCRGKLDNLKILINNRTATTLFGVPCIDVLQQSDYAFNKLFNFIPSIWNDTYCSQCLKDTASSGLANAGNVIILVNEPLVLFHTLRVLGLPHQFYNLPVYTETAQDFFKTLFNVVDCFSHHLINSSVSLLDVLSLPVEDLVVFNQSVCTDCSSLYLRLLHIYETRLMEVKEEGVKSSPGADFQFTSRFTVCHDVQYAINRTQWAWYHLMGCDNKSDRIVGILLPVLICLAMIVLFHSLLYTVFRNPNRIIIYLPRRVEARQPLLEHQASSETVLGSFPSYGTMDTSGGNVQTPGHPIDARVLRTTSLEYENTMETSAGAPNSVSLPRNLFRRSISGL